jgi:hypothetical protein
VPAPRPSADPGGNAQLRRMVLLLETAAVLEARARRCGDPAQVAVLLRRAEHRRSEAVALREQLAARGAALAPDRAERFTSTAARRPQFRSSPAAGRGHPSPSPSW